MGNINVHFNKIFDLLWHEDIVKRYDDIYQITSILNLKSLGYIECVNV